MYLFTNCYILVIFPFGVAINDILWVYELLVWVYVSITHGYFSRRRITDSFVEFPSCFWKCLHQLAYSPTMYMGSNFSIFGGGHTCDAQAYTGLYIQELLLVVLVGPCWGLNLATCKANPLPFVLPLQPLFFHILVHTCYCLYFSLLSFGWMWRVIWYGHNFHFLNNLLSTFSHAYWTFIYIIWRDSNSNPLPIFNCIITFL